MTSNPMKSASEGFEGSTPPPRMLARHHQDDLTFLVRNPEQNLKICDCYWVGGRPNSYSFGYSSRWDFFGIVTPKGKMRFPPIFTIVLDASRICHKIDTEAYDQ